MTLLNESTEIRIAYIDFLIDELLHEQQTDSSLEDPDTRGALNALVNLRQCYYYEDPDAPRTRPSGPTTLELPDDNPEN